MTDKLFDKWLKATAKLQEDCYGVDYAKFHDDSQDSLRAVIEYMRWNMLAIDDELAEVRKAISWKPWQHDDPYVDRREVLKECVDVLHFVANIICAVGGTDDELNEEYLAKMQKNADRQKKGYRVLEAGMKCTACARALDDYDVDSCREARCPQRSTDEAR